MCPALAYTRESGNPSEKLVMGKSGLSGRGRKDGGGVRGGGAQMRNPEEVERTAGCVCVWGGWGAQMRNPALGSEKISCRRRNRSMHGSQNDTLG